MGREEGSWVGQEEELIKLQPDEWGCWVVDRAFGAGTRRSKGAQRDWRSAAQGPLMLGLTQKTLCFILRLLEGSLGGSMKVANPGEEEPRRWTILRSPKLGGPPTSHSPARGRLSSNIDPGGHVEGPGAQRSLASPSGQSR